MQASPTITCVGVPDRDLSLLFQHIKQQQFPGTLVSHSTLSGLLLPVLRTDTEADQQLGLVLLYYRENALLAPDHLCQLRQCKGLAQVPVVVYARQIDAATEQRLDELDVYAAIIKPADEQQYAEHAAAFIHMCYFWNRHYSEYKTLQTRRMKNQD